MDDQREKVRTWEQIIYNYEMKKRNADWNEQKRISTIPVKKLSFVGI